MRTVSEINGREFRHVYGKSTQIQAAIDLNQLRHSLTRATSARKRKPTVTAEPAPHPSPSQRWLTRAQAATLLSMTEEQVRGLVRHGHLVEGEHFFKPSPRILRFDRIALERWLTKRRPAPTKTEKKSVTKEELREHLEKCIAQKMPG
ncbi:MAG: helix-turn-helix domain-containing protein [Candidatus Binatia bacterium]